MGGGTYFLPLLALQLAGHALLALYLEVIITRYGALDLLLDALQPVAEQLKVQYI